MKTGKMGSAREMEGGLKQKSLRETERVKVRGGGRMIRSRPQVVCVCVCVFSDEMTN